MPQIGIGFNTNIINLTAAVIYLQPHFKGITGLTAI